MRNLKRVLSLALASAMLLGMMVMGAGAADKKASDLTDMDKVTNKEAVNLMVDLGIIVGKPDGTFAPTEVVDRATMSKLIYFVLTGSDDASAFKGINTGLKDVTGNWAEGFINYCYSIGILTGDGAGSFYPGNKVTVVAAAKMLLVALGYDAAASKYQNDSMWSVNIMRDAQAAGLLNNVNQNSNDELTRDNAALMIFNALFAKTVTPKYSYDMGVKYIDEYVKGDTLGYNTYKLVKVTGTVTGLTDGKAVFTTTNPTGLKNNVSGKVLAPNDMLGKTGVVYVKAVKSVDAAGNVTGYTFDKLYSTTVTAGASTILGTSTDGTPMKTLPWPSTGGKDLTTNTSANKGFIAEMDTKTVTTADDTYAISVFVDGANKTSEATLTTAGNTFTLGVTTNGKIAVRGNVVDLIDSDNSGKADIIKVTTKAVYTLTADAATKVVDKDTQVKVPGVSGITNFSSTYTTKNVKGFEGLVKGDVVLVSIVDGVYFIEKANVVEGVVSGTNASGDIKIDGTYYKNSQITNAKNEWASTDADWTNTYKFYLDNGNNIVKAVKVTNEDVAGENTILLATQWQGGDLGTGGYMQAKFLMTDGTTEVVKLAKVDGTKMNSTHINASAPAKNIFYTYTVNSDGNYEIKTVTKNTEALGSKIDNNKKLFDGVNLGGENTVFIVEVTDKDDSTSKTYKTYTGIASVPTMSTVTGGRVITKDGLASYAFVQVGSDKISGIDTDAVFFYIPDTTKYTFVPKTSSNPMAYYEYTAYLNGDKTTVKLSTQAAAGDTNKLFTASVKTAEEVYTNATVKTEGTDVVSVANGGTLKVGSTVYSYDSDTKVYLINGDKELGISELKVDATDTVTVIAGTDNYAKIVFVRENISSATAFTGVDVYVNGTKATVTGGNATAGTIASAKEGDKIEIKLTGLSAGASYTVSTKTVPASGTMTFSDIVVTAEDGTQVSAADYVLSITTIAPKG